MRFRRLVLPLLTAVALAAAMLATPAPSSAAMTRSIVITASGEKGDTGTFYVVGRVQDWNREYVRLQKRDCRRTECKWHDFKSTVTGSRGGFRFDFGGRIGNCFRIFVRAADGYKMAIKPVGCIVRG